MSSSASAGRGRIWAVVVASVCVCVLTTALWHVVACADSVLCHMTECRSSAMADATAVVAQWVQGRWLLRPGL